MRTIDELRRVAAKTEEANGRCGKLYRGDLEQLADAIEAELADHYVELPVDADGEHIHIGDVMDNTHKDGFRAKRVTGICYHEGGHMTIEVDEVRLRWHDAGKLRHHHPPTVEDVLREFADLVRKERIELATVSEGTIAEYAAKLRLAGSEDE